MHEELLRIGISDTHRTHNFVILYLIILSNIGLTVYYPNT